MKALVIYDSVFGNTEQVAQTMGEALSAQTEVTTSRVTDVSPEQLTEAQYLIVGSPTRGFQPTADTKKLLKSLPTNGLQGVRVAAFDTRVSVEDANSFVFGILVKFFGYGAKPIANLLKKAGGELIMPPEGFLVEGTEGPLKDGELERAADWARQILDTP